MKPKKYIQIIVCDKPKLKITVEANVKDKVRNEIGNIVIKLCDLSFLTVYRNFK